MPYRSIRRREFLQAGIAAAAMAVGVGRPRAQRFVDQPFELAEASLTDLGQRLGNQCLCRACAGNCLYPFAAEVFRRDHGQPAVLARPGQAAVRQ